VSLNCELIVTVHCNFIRKFINRVLLHFKPTVFIQIVFSTVNDVLVQWLRIYDINVKWQTKVIDRIFRKRGRLSKAGTQMKTYTKKHADIFCEIFWYCLKTSFSWPDRPVTTTVRLDSEPGDKTIQPCDVSRDPDTRYVTCFTRTRSRWIIFCGTCLYTQPR